MKHKITLSNKRPSKYFESNSAFKSVIITKIKYSDQKDIPNLSFNWLHGPFGAIFSIPISETFANQQDKFDLIKMAKSFDEPFKGPFNRLVIKLEHNFKETHQKLLLKLN